MSRAKELLRGAGLAPTVNRRLVLRALLDEPEALSAREIWRAAATDHPVNQATVYRILDLLTVHGLVQRLAAQADTHRYCLRGQSPHAHLHCRGCGRVVCLRHAPLDDPCLRALRDSSPWPVENVEVRMDGVCAACRAS